MVWMLAASACALAVFTVFAQNDPEARLRPPPAPVHELGAAGQKAGFEYRRLPDDPEVYVVTLAETGEQVLVSRSFLSLMVQGNMPEDIQRTALKSYPGMVQQHFDEMMETTFPDAAKVYAEPFEAVESTVEDGTLIQVNPDPLAPPYVRVTVREPDGGEDSFSVSRQFVDNILSQEDANGNLLLSAVTSFPFRLPETLRPDFAGLSREALTDAVLKTPSLQRQEIIQMPRFYRERAAAVLDALSNAVPHTARRRPLAEAAGMAPGFEPRATRGQPRRSAPAIVRPKSAPAPLPGAQLPARKPPTPARFWPALGVPLAAFAAYAWFHRRRKP